MEQAQKEHKPLLVDIWAAWCVACIQMEHSTWKNPEIISLLQENYVSVKLDYTEAPEDLGKWVNSWQVTGLPAILIFAKEDNSYKIPLKRFEGVVPDSEFIEKLTP